MSHGTDCFSTVASKLAERSGQRRSQYRVQPAAPEPQPPAQAPEPEQDPRARKGSIGFTRGASFKRSVTGASEGGGAPAGDDLGGSGSSWSRVRPSRAVEAPKLTRATSHRVMGPNVITAPGPSSAAQVSSGRTSGYSESGEVVAAPGESPGVFIPDSFDAFMAEPAPSIRPPPTRVFLQLT